MAGYVPLPAYQVPRNAMLDFSGLNAGIDAIAERNQNAMNRAERAEERTYQRGRQAATDAREQTRFANEQTDRTRKNYSETVKSVAGFIQQNVIPEKDPARRKQLMDQLFDSHPDLKNAPDAFRDPVTGPELFLSTARGYMDPLDRRKTEAEIRKLEADAAHAGSKNALEESIAQMLHDGGSPPNSASSPPPPDGGTYQPQNYQPQAPAMPGVQRASNAMIAPNAIPPPGQTAPRFSQPDQPIPGNAMLPTRPPAPPMLPGITLAADGEPQPAGPGIEAGPAEQPTGNGTQPGAVYNMPGEEQINTPLGRMTRDRARRVGMGLAAAGKGDAGRMMIDAASGGGLTKPTANAIQEKQLNATEAFSRLRSIEQSFKPEYQTIETRIGNKWSELVDSFSSTRKSLTPQQKTQLAEFSAYRADALNNLNQYIKEITGAAMTNAEADRIMKAMPNPGDGVFNGDSPTVFKAKLDAAIRSSKMALARYQYLSKNGFTGSADDMAKQLPLEKMGSVIQDRTRALTQEALSQNPGTTPQDVAPLIRQRLRAEFGLDV